MSDLVTNLLKSLPESCELGLQFLSVRVQLLLHFLVALREQALEALDEWGHVLLEVL